MLKLLKIIIFNRPEFFVFFIILLMVDIIIGYRYIASISVDFISGLSTHIEELWIPAFNHFPAFCYTEKNIELYHSSSIIPCVFEQNKPRVDKKHLTSIQLSIEFITLCHQLLQSKQIQSKLLSLKIFHP